MKNPLNFLMPRGLFARSLLILTVPVILIQVITTYMFYDRHWEKMTSRLAFAVSGEVAVIADYVEKTDNPTAVADVSSNAARHLDLLVSFEPDAKLKDDDIRDKFKRARTYIVLSILSNSLEAQLRRPFTLNMDADERWVQISVQVNNGVLDVSLPQRRMFSSSGHIFLMWMVGISTILLIVAVLFMRNQIRPIRKLAVAAERFGRGLDVPGSFKPTGAREVRQAAQAFMNMHDRIRRQIQQRTAMLAGVSHDLRTPLTRMKLQLAMMKGTDADALKSDIGDMEKMIDAYLDFARGQGGEASGDVDVGAMMDYLATQARRQDFPVDLSLSGDLLAQVRPIALQRAVNNLITNACKYGNHVWLSVRRDGDYIEIIVDDNGPGIPADQYDEVFKPFVRGEPSRNPHTGGVGLGLPIAQDIIHSHGGNIWLEKSPRGGLRACILIPA